MVFLVLLQVVIKTMPAAVVAADGECGVSDCIGRDENWLLASEANPPVNVGTALGPDKQFCGENGHPCSVIANQEKGRCEYYKMCGSQ